MEKKVELRDLQTIWEELTEHPDYLTGNIWGKGMIINGIAETLENDKHPNDLVKINNWIDENKVHLIGKINEIIFDYEKNESPLYDVAVYKYYQDHDLLD